MTATNIYVNTVAIDLAGDASDISTNISFRYELDSNITTLSKHGALVNNAQGYLYTPDLSDPTCIAASAPYIPQNTTRISDLPAVASHEQLLIAIAPWTTAECMLQYFKTEGINAFFVFLPGDSTDKPPHDSNAVWDLGDGGDWKAATNCPIFALPGQAGQVIMDALAQYSGNISDEPYGQQLSQSYSPSDFVRLSLSYNYDSESAAVIPVWGAIVLVVGALLAFAALISGALHYRQYERRANLRRRVANGEVDLEALGIKRLTIPQDVLDKMPLYMYGTDRATSISCIPGAHTSTKVTSPKAEEAGSGTSSRTPSVDPNKRPTGAARAASYNPAPLDQPTCAICLDDFVPAGATNPVSEGETATTEGTTVRELPCRHIFHPECVDAFLKDNSSLCPMCKRTALPRGYCPDRITDAMVRRERRARNLRPGQLEDGVLIDRAEAAVSRRRRDPNWRYGQRSPAAPEVVVDSVGPIQVGTALQDLSPGGVGITNTATSLQPPPAPPQDAESSASTESARTIVPPVQPPATPGRREWARERAIAMLGGRIAPEDPDEEERRQMSGWRRGVTTLFPGLLRR